MNDQRSQTMTGAAPGGPGHDFQLDVRSRETDSLVARYFLYDSPLDLITDGGDIDRWSSSVADFVLTRIPRYVPPVVDYEIPDDEREWKGSNDD